MKRIAGFLVVAVGLCAACSADESADVGLDSSTGDQREAAIEVPQEFSEPRQAGNAEVSSFAGFNATVDELRLGDGMPGFHDDGLDAMIERSDVAVVGAVEKFELVESLMELPGVSPAAVLTLRIHVSGDDAMQARRFDGVVHREVWIGDPALLATVHKRLDAELGPGPVGATAAVLARRSGVGYQLVGGLVEDAGKQRTEPLGAAPMRAPSVAAVAAVVERQSSS